MKNEQDIVVRSKGGLETNLRQNITLSLLAFFTLFLCFCVSKDICSFLFCASNDIKNVQFGVKMRENLKVFGDRVPFAIYPSCNQLQLNYNSNSCNLDVQTSLSLVRPRPKLMIYLA
jgi:hypothetical protein